MEAVVSWEWPTSIIEVRSFLCLTVYYRLFIKGFSQIVLCLTKLTRKNVSFEWTSEYERSFKELKEKLTTAPVLILPDPCGLVMLQGRD